MATGAAPSSPSPPSTPSPPATPWEVMLGRAVVIDVTGPFVILGTLVRRHEEWIVLRGADVHDLRDTPTTRDKYVLDCRAHGLRPNRDEAWVRLAEIVCVCRLDDVLLG